MHVFVISSLHEGMPNAILEAAACGTPIVATAVDGICDLFRDGENALLVDPGNPGAMSRAIVKVLTHDRLARRLSAGALATAARITPEIEREIWLKLYRSCAEESAIAAGRGVGL
jgi:glycosyltransferase involved in cell wall biosynthesis